MESKDPSIASIGSINFDVTSKVEKPPQPGETVTSSASWCIGGKGFNQAVAAHRASGGQALFIGKLGSDELSELVRTRAEKEVPCDFRYTHGKCGMAFIEVSSSQSGQNTIRVAPGVNATCSIDQVEDVLESKSPKIILVQNEIAPETTLKAMRYASERGIFSILDPAPANSSLTKEMIQAADLITPNASELQTLCERFTSLRPIARRIHRESGREFYSRCIQELGCDRMIVTLEGDGVIYIQKESTPLPLSHTCYGETFFRTYEAYNPQVVYDTSGAGDCFNGALAASLAREEELDEAIQYGMAAAALSVQEAGTSTSMPEKAKIEIFQHRQGSPLML